MPRSAEIVGCDFVEERGELNRFAFLDVIDADGDLLSGGIAACIGGDDVEGIGGFGFEVRRVVDGDFAGMRKDAESPPLRASLTADASEASAS